MQDPIHGTSLDQAPQVCMSCKARKRRCDKGLPKCSPCSKRNLVCRYLKPHTSPSTPGATRQWGSSVIDEAETLVNRAQTLDLPTISFLDSSILRYGHIDLPHPNPPIPDHVLHLLGDTASLRATATKFFKYTHVWLPFISKPRFCNLHLPPAAPPHLDSWHSHTSADTILLHLSLLLITTLPPTNPQNPQIELYRAVKHFYLDVEQTGILSLTVVQAGVLISLYELGQGIYPAAYLSIAACARYAHVLGIGVSEHGGTQTRKILTQVEMEESRRAWWAIVILDRFISIASPGRPLAAAEPGLDSLLPSDDEAWDQGIVSRKEKSTLSTPMSGHMSKFALLCQAARLLGQVLQYLSGPVDDEVEMQLDRTLQAMVTACLEVENPDYDQITFIYR
ncbi:hypothetical protein IFR04_011044 [Cadophora malorum]|uniref:Zn(2)-C6 fungal-type domain-containing protein n=1 Tax=Cadophora malorum TaxID=108018 RepID=A0A8H7W3H3_9HELO|nr:hypothetical protein IFR04_011044 [Cadophora malorum]